MPIKPFLEISDSYAALAHSPMVRGIIATFAYIAENGPIGLTPSGTFKRVFVQWAAEVLIGQDIDQRISTPSTRS